MRNFGNLLILLLITFDLSTGSEIDISLSAPKESVFIGEAFELELMIKRCDSQERVSPIFVEPKMKHIWLKKAYKSIHLQEDNCSVDKRRYLVAAQQSGLLRIAPLEVRLAFNEDQHDAWGNLKMERYWESHYSNTLELHVKNLPADTTLVGEFTFVLDVERRDVAANAAVYAEITIEGVGNFEDISVVLPVISGVNVFTEEPRLEQTDSENREIWRQKIVFTGEDDFAIPSMSLEYFDLDEEGLKKIQTEAVCIKIIGDKSASLAKTVEKNTVQSSREILIWWMAVAGIIGVAFITGLVKRVLFGRQQTKKVSHRDHKGVLHLLLLHKDDEGIEEIIEQLEAYVYEGKEMIIDQKKLKKIVKKYQQRS